MYIAMEESAHINYFAREFSYILYFITCYLILPFFNRIKNKNIIFPKEKTKSKYQLILKCMSNLDLTYRQSSQLIVDFHPEYQCQSMKNCIHSLSFKYNILYSLQLQLSFVYYYYYYCFDLSKEKFEVTKMLVRSHKSKKVK